jgi:hypothetical protein
MSGKVWARASHILDAAQLQLTQLGIDSGRSMAVSLRSRFETEASPTHCHKYTVS